ncbi:MAG: methionyl-tRNA formyltransferase [Planctomycetota bacterium]
MRIVFLGSGAFGIPTLDALSARHEVVAVVSQPDKPAGRGKVLTPTPLAVRAAELGIPLTKPIDINEPSVCAAARAHQADAWVIIAFGQKLSRELLDGVFAVNLHGSLLPAYRGAAPIQRAVMDGCAQTGVSVISLAERMDAGLVYATRSRAIGASETSDDVHDALALLGPEVIEDVLARRNAGVLVGAVQDESRATRARKLAKSDGTVDFAARDAHSAAAWINGLNSWPGCTVLIGGLQVKLLRVREVVGGEHGIEYGIEHGIEPAVEPRASATLGQDGLVRAKAGVVEIMEVQPLGGRRMAFEEFIRGRQQLVGSPIVPVAGA